MQTQKMSLAGIQGKLSRAEMKSIMAGSGCYKCCWTGTSNCSVGVSCSASCTCVSGATLTSC